MTAGDPYATFRPIGGRVVPLVVGALAILLFVVVAIALPSESKWGVPDRLMVAAIGPLLCLGLWRFAQVRAIPTREGLEVHNLLVTRQLDWAQIVDVQFGGGAAWVMLELDNFDTVAVMGIQRSDGPRARAEAERLAALVEAHSRRGRG